jgi:hypothetical protein
VLVVLSRLPPPRPARLPRLPLVLPATTFLLLVVFLVPLSASLPFSKQLNLYAYQHYNKKMSA